MVVICISLNDYFSHIYTCKILYESFLIRVRVTSSFYDDSFEWCPNTTNFMRNLWRIYVVNLFVYIYFCIFCYRACIGNAREVYRGTRLSASKTINVFFYCEIKYFIMIVCCIVQVEVIVHSLQSSNGNCIWCNSLLLAVFDALIVGRCVAA